ncbi:MAG: ssuE 1 [Modestobacter sp.]|jgi:FMN reductase|nr:ssuE 1 [Modestobacter sp.]
MTVALVVGNPKQASRTLDAGVALATALTDGPPDVVIDVATLGAGLLGWGDQRVRAAVQQVASSDVAVFASPTYKATYTGLIKLFLDQFATGAGLRGVVAVPLMLGAGPSHAMAPDLLLKPVLVELGATCPTPGLYLLDTTFAEAPTLGDFAVTWAPVVAATAAVWKGSVRCT